MRACFKTQVFINPYETAERLAMDFIRYTEYMFEFREKLYIAVSGGTTPQTWFSILAGEYSHALDWEKIHFFWVDERCVPFNSDESNFGVADRLLFQKVAIPRANLHPIHGAENPINEVVRYTGEILAHVPCTGKFPVFDVVLLGMGNDGHTASIFPGQPDLFDTSAICSVNKHPKTGQNRITLTGKVINNAQDIIFLVTGDTKAHQIKDLFNNSPSSYQFPAKQIKPVNGRLSWYFDKKAVAYIEGKI